MNALETNRLTKEYSPAWGSGTKLVALDNLNLHVEEGRIFGFLGPNGAGKSTTIKLMLGLINPTSGSGSLFGIPIHDKKAREQVGFLPEDPSFCTYLTAAEFLDLCGKILHMDSGERKRRSAEILKMVGMEAKAKTRISEFSRGMMQRIGLAQALLHQPNLVVLDEPLNGLDPYGRKELKAILHEQKAAGKTVFFSSHILSDVEEMCDEVGILNQGRLIASGKLDQLLPVKRIKLQIQSMTMDTMGELEPICNSMSREHNHWILELAKPGDRELVCGILRKDHPQNIEVHTTTESLEEYFFRIIEEDNLKRNPTTKKSDSHE